MTGAVIPPPDTAARYLPAPSRRQTVVSTRLGRGPPLTAAPQLMTFDSVVLNWPCKDDDRVWPPISGRVRRHVTIAASRHGGTHGRDRHVISEQNFRQVGSGREK